MKRFKKDKSQKTKKSILGWLLTLPIILSFIGIFFVFEASSVRSYSEYGNSFHYAQLQAIWIGVGILAIIFFSLLNYHKLYYFSFPLMLLSIFFLIIVLIPGVGHKAGGAQRWIDLGIINFQPTEFSKLATIIYLSSWFIHRERKRFFSFLLLIGILMFLIMAQPDMGTAVTIFLTGTTLYFLAGIEMQYLFFLAPISLAIFFILIKISPYRFKRLLAFYNPNLDPLGVTYHINQIIISLSNGGLFGEGFGASKQKYLFLPEAHTDSIFAIVGEELGFFGATLVIATFLFLIYIIFRVADNAKDRFGKLLSGGILAFFGFQIIINLSGMVNLLPLTGIPLPFFSYGGSNLLISCILIGICINVARQSKI